MSNLAIILISSAVFLALIIWLTVDTEHVKRWTGIAFLIAIAGGIFIYGTIDASQFSSMPIIAVLRTVVHVGKMFGNAGDGSHDSFVGIVGDNTFTSAFYWLVHFFAYYSVVSAVILVIGRDIVRGFRTWLLRIHDIELIYGIDDNTVSLGETLAKGRRVSLVFVGKGTISDSILNRTGALVYGDNDAMNPNTRFIKRISLVKGKGKLRVSALSDDDEANYAYAMKMLRSLKEADILPSQTELVMFGRAAHIGSEFQALGDHYGYGSVKVFERRELSARLLLWKYPLADTVSFDTKGKATGEVEILIAGFGAIGQEVLRKVVAQGQYYGSTFHVHVFDPAYDKRNGFFNARYPGLISNYDIQFEAFDARSERFADYVRDKAEKLNLIVVAVGSGSVGKEITYGIIDVLDSCGLALPVYQCLDDKVIRYRMGDECVITSVFDAEIMYGTSLDALSKEINHFYYKEGSAEEQWRDCDYFSRTSCNASADYLKGLLGRTGAPGGDDELMENLAQSEHLRWMAFHYSMGYQTMTTQEREKRAQMYLKDNKVRILKDTVNKHHGCLVPWDELDELSEFENSYTGKNLDYKQMDRENIKAVSGIIFSKEK